MAHRTRPIPNEKPRVPLQSFLYESETEKKMLARPILRASRRAANGVRYNSTTGEAANKAAGKAKETANKAAEGLSRVTSAAGPAISGAAKGVAGSLSKVGGRTGKVINFIESMSQLPRIYPRGWSRPHRTLLPLGSGSIKPAMML